MFETWQGTAAWFAACAAVIAIGYVWRRVKR
jgi:hypothetical protein